VRRTRSSVASPASQEAQRFRRLPVGAARVSLPQVAGGGWRHMRITRTPESEPDVSTDLSSAEFSPPRPARCTDGMPDRPEAGHGEESSEVERKGGKGFLQFDDEPLQRVASAGLRAFRSGRVCRANVVSMFRASVTRRASACPYFRGYRPDCCGIVL
jgi:hypothetical protein